MKKALLALALAVLLLLVACGKETVSEKTDPEKTVEPTISLAVREVCDAIDTLGEVETLSIRYELDVIAAEKLYKNLTDAEKEQVSNYQILADARARIDAIHAELDSIEAALAGYGSVPALEDGEALTLLQHAAAAYGAG